MVFLKYTPLNSFNPNIYGYYLERSLNTKTIKLFISIKTDSNGNSPPLFRGYKERLVTSNTKVLPCPDNKKKKKK